MQMDLNTNYNALDLAVDILGVNAAGLLPANAWFTSVADVPWLQDVDANNNGQSDVWQAWQVTYRDVIILDGDNEPVAKFNLTDQNLQFFQNYSTLRRLFVEAASVNAMPGDFNGNGAVEQGDLDLVLLNWGDVLVNPGAAGWIESLPIGGVDQGELDAVLLNWGNSAALAQSAAVPEPRSIALILLAMAALASRYKAPPSNAISRRSASPIRGPTVCARIGADTANTRGRAS